ncbi:MAG: hypothetical protein BMS9Abin06_0020 [Gammaproteobacteria bacterium]|nr:MAG: hypothetical protein BMS9Abin06_0020 [Gammaproteobacteria bacterium]
MSVNITINAGYVPMTPPVNAANQPNQGSGDIKDNTLARLDTRKEQIDNRADHINTRRNERLQAAEGYTREQGYARLADRLNGAIETVNATDQRVGEIREQRFNRAEQLIEHRPQGGYNISQQNAESIVSKIEQNTEALTSALENRSAVVGERYAGLEQKLIETGRSGDRASAFGERSETRLERTVERVESRSEQAIERVNKRIEAGYGVTTETAGLQNEEDGLLGETTDVMI